MAIVVRRTPSTRALPLTEPVRTLDIDRFASDVWDSWSPFHYHYHRSEIPADVYEEKDFLVIKAEMPGFRKEDIEVGVTGDLLTIKGEKKGEEVPEESTYESEICYGDYSRTIELPFAVKSEKAAATFENGLLEIKLPKAEEARSRHIEVKVK